MLMVMKEVHMIAIELIFELVTIEFNFPSPDDSLRLKLYLKINVSPNCKNECIFCITVLRKFGGS